MADTSKGIVIVADDESEIRGVYRRTLEREGYDVIEFGKIEDAEEEYHRLTGLETKPAAVILDNDTKSSKQGMDLAEIINPKESQVPVVVISGDFLRYRELEERAGAVGAKFIEKRKLVPDELVGIIERFHAQGKSGLSP